MLGRRVRWPVGDRGSFALNGNHEMYARGKAYFEHLLPRLGLRDGDGFSGQRASFFCLRSDHWLLLGLDTGYHSIGLPVLEKIFKPNCRLDDRILDWLRKDVRVHEDRHRGILLLTHHQYYSQFESHYEKAAEQLSALLTRPALWFWGHEHRWAIYGRHATRKGRLEAYGRCLGHGGLPIEDIVEEPRADGKHRVGLVLYDRRERTRIDEGRVPVGYNGYALLEFDGGSLTVEYRDATGRTPVRERWEVGSGGVLRGVSIEKLSDDPGLKLHSARLEDALR